MSYKLMTRGKPQECRVASRVKLLLKQKHYFGNKIGHIICYMMGVVP